ncbi:hypothetical protein FHW72_002109 [Ochrobactrum sp. RC6B]|jgi:hypothetical protein|uniref:PepSY domain-containing protein n=1 Tax=Brucella intermedia TaxID=94625 RepID=A0ABR6ASF1_9HYPH|nr:MULTISPECIES: hypothetical protein [Brucella/Ochrobactrum group]ERI16083.1 hypothetical protein O206_16400 [Ochrobactrum sp. EGD-AQ16]KAB2706811.1 hypothetical protein F9K80_20420 [Brucella intermedia]MBA8845405.1 hypothetical protein [Ochrobactrum sp. RH1CCR137]MBA8852370.1 hypothetical protein [Brucella intermedia]MBA8857067.1 hypothetical protein [Ochrobactrum sp. RH1CCR134]
MNIPAILLASALVIVPTVGSAQDATTTPNTPSTNAPAPNANAPTSATPTTHDDKAPDAGQNSFTEEQATERFTKAGYTGISNLKLNDKGLWEASAMKGAETVMVTLDADGNVTAHSM